MRVQEWGDRSDVPLVLCHGAGVDAGHSGLRELAPAIASAGFLVLGVHGLSLEQLHELVERRELARPVLMGDEGGSALAVEYAGSHPDDVRALVVVGVTEEIRGVWPVIASHEIPALLYPTWDGREGAPLGDEIANWLVEQGL